MDPHDRRHGSYAGGQAHIRAKTAMCEPCRQAFLRYRRRRRYDNAAGRARMIPTGPVIEHLNTLRAAGVIMHDIAARAGVSPSLIEELFSNPRDSIRADNAAAILGTTPPPTATGRIPAVGTLRRIQALGAIGWSMTDIETVGNGAINIHALRRLTSFQPEHVQVSTAEAVDAAYRRLCMAIPPTGRNASQVRGKARAKGWLPPLAWHDIDDPDERPTELRRPWHDGPSHDVIDEAVVERILGGDFSLAREATTAERREVVRRWRRADPLAGQRGHAREDGQRPSLAFLGRLTGWRVERYTQSNEDGAA